MQAFFELILSWIKKLIALIRGETVVDGPVDPIVSEETVVCYYGCPNSKKAQKLQLKKRPLR